jgi:hypothetical protein
VLDQKWPSIAAHKAAINRLSPAADCVLACEIPSEEYLKNIDVKKSGRRRNRALGRTQ